ncbi:MAG: chalcone isomerase family protein [Proteobacteria bacterium]|nr:chalcone isomerase family protein [Pseudomonadota bacterium]
MIKKLALLLSCFCFANVVFADSVTEVLGVSLPYELNIGTPQEKLTLNGHAVATLWGTQAFVGALYTPQNEKRAEMLILNDQPLLMMYYFVRDDISAQMLSQALTEAILINSGGWEDKKLDKARLLELKAAIDRSYNAGDTLGFYYSPTNGVTMIVNGKETKHWPHAKSFYNMLLRTWIGPYPPTRAFKRAILNFPVNA